MTLLSCSEQSGQKELFKNDKYKVLFIFNDKGHFKTSYYQIERLSDKRISKLDLKNDNIFIDSNFIYTYTNGQKGKSYWIFIKNYKFKDYDFVYDSIPANINLDNSKLAEGVYKLSGDSLNKVSKLNQINDFYSLETGFYFVTYPGVLYKGKRDFESFFNQ